MGNNDIQFLPVTPAQIKAAQKQAKSILRDGQIDTNEMAEINSNPLLKAQLGQRMGFAGPVGPGFGRANGRQGGQPGQLTGGYQAPMPQFRGRVNPNQFAYYPYAGSNTDNNPENGYPANLPPHLVAATNGYMALGGMAYDQTMAGYQELQQRQQQFHNQQMQQLADRLAQAERNMADLARRNQELTAQLAGRQQPSGGTQPPTTGGTAPAGGTQPPTGGPQPPGGVAQPQPTGGAQPPARTDLQVPPEISAQYFQVRDWYKDHLKRSETECNMDHECILAWARYLKNHAPNNEPAKINEVRLLIRNSNEGIRKNGNTRENSPTAPAGH